MFALMQEQWGQQANPGDMTLPEYEAWRAERNRIDEARISRQRTAEGNWRREWDNDKVHLADEATKRENRVTLGDVVDRQEHGENEKHYRSPRTAPRNMNYGGHRGPYHATAAPEASRNYGSANDSEKRVVIATDKSIKVSVNHGTTPPKSSVMSVKGNLNFGSPWFDSIDRIDCQCRVYSFFEESFNFCMVISLNFQ